MKSFIPNEAAGFVQEHKNYRRYAAVLVCLAVVVALATMFGLRLHGRAMTKEVRVFDCAVEPHQHTEDCYVEVDGQKVLNCGQADFMVHSHNLDCYDPDTGELVCQLPEIQEHEHTAECGQTTRELTCGQTEAPAHTHDESCLTTIRTLTCGLEESAAGHTHTEDCYAPGEPVLVCGLEEHTHTDACFDETGAQTCALEEHAHTDACYAPGDPVLICGQTESAGHTHTDACYTTEEALTCGLEAGEGHTHTDDCYTETTTLSCELPEVKLHTHSDDCWTPLAELEDMTDDELAELDLTADDLPALRTREVTDEATGETTTEALTCGQLEVLEHTHSEADGCYHYETVEVAEDEDEEDETTPDGETGTETGEPLCGLEEHTHTDACYDENGDLICGLEEHTHTEDCYAPADGTDDAAGDEAAATPETAAPETVPVLSCGLEEHTHSDACYSDEKILVCGLEEGEDHTHDDSCYFTERVLSCGKTEHTHTADCYTDEYLATSCYDASGKLICGKPEHTHTAACYARQMVLTCDLEEGPDHTHTEDCYEEKLVLVCEIEEHAHIAPEGLQVKVSQQVGDLLVTATYGLDAKIPADAEFRVEEIKPQSEQDAEFDQYTDKAFDAVYESSGDDVQVNPVALLSIGFYLPDGTEVEPEGTVNIAVQFLNAEESGVAEGDGVSVVHFADDDTTEVLTGTDVDGEAATSFDTDSFSRFYVTTTNNAVATIDNASIMGISNNDTNFDHNKRIDYLGDNRDPKNSKDNPDTSLDDKNGGLTVTDDLYRLYLDMTGKSEPVDLVIVIDRSNSMSETMNGKTRWQTVYDILEGTKSDGSDGLLSKFLAANKGKSTNAEKNFVSVVWFAGQFYDRTSGTYGTANPWVYPNNSREGGTVFGWTSSYTHHGTGNYTISPYKGVSWGVACTNYVAGLYQAHQKLNNLPSGTENHRKVVVFMSDGIPVYYYKANSLNWDRPSSMYRYGGGAEDYTYKDWSGSSLIRSYSGNSTAKNFYDSPYFNETLKIFKSGSNSFVAKHPNITFHTIAIDLAGEKINGWDRTKLLADMAGSYTGGKMFNVSSSSQLQEYLRSIMFPAGVTISDTLSANVKLLSDQPDIKVTATPKGSSTPIDLWTFTGKKLNKTGDITSLGTFGTLNGTNANGNIIKQVNYDGKTISVVFAEDYCLGAGYTYTLSFNVKLTDTAYNEYAKNNGSYNDSGDSDTDYTGNSTSSTKGGLFSNAEAKASYTVDNEKHKLPYDDPVVQAWGSYFQIHKSDTSGNDLAGMQFQLYNTDTNTVIAPINPKHSASNTSFYDTDANGNMQWDMLPVGHYALKECLKKGYAGYFENKGAVRTVATFEVYKGRITNMKVEDVDGDPTNGSQPAVGITVHNWDNEAFNFDTENENSTPNTKYGIEDDAVALNITNEPDGYKLELYKVDEYGENLGWVEFKLTDTDNTVYTGISDPATGLFFSDYLAADIYKLEETKALEGYVTLKDPIYLKVTKNGVEFVDANGSSVKQPECVTKVDQVQDTDADGNPVFDKKDPSKPVYKCMITLSNKLKSVEMQIKKVNSFDNETPLKGAQFELYKATDEWEKLIDQDDKEIDANGLMWKGESGEDGLLSVGDDNKPFPQLKAGKYLLIETEAPEGYMILHEEIRIEVKLEDNVLNVYYTLPPDGKPEHAVASPAGPDPVTEVITYTLNVPNSDGTELPRTGGIGTRWFTLGGLALMAIALSAGILAGRKRRKA